jgi:hypothetical protein
MEGFQRKASLINKLISDLPAPEPFPKTGFQITTEQNSRVDLPRFELSANRQ